MNMDTNDVDSRLNAAGRQSDYLYAQRIPGPAEEYILSSHLSVDISARQHRQPRLPAPGHLFLDREEDKDLTERDSRSLHPVYFQNSRAEYEAEPRDFRARSASLHWPGRGQPIDTVEYNPPKAEMDRVAQYVGYVDSDFEDESDQEPPPGGPKSHSGRIVPDTHKFNNSTRVPPSDMRTDNSTTHLRKKQTAILSKQHVPQRVKRQRPFVQSSSPESDGVPENGEPSEEDGTSEIDEPSGDNHSYGTGGKDAQDKEGRPQSALAQPVRNRPQATSHSRQLTTQMRTHDTSQLRLHISPQAPTGSSRPTPSQAFTAQTGQLNFKSRIQQAKARQGNPANTAQLQGNSAKTNATSSSDLSRQRVGYLTEQAPRRLPVEADTTDVASRTKKARPKGYHGEVSPDGLDKQETRMQGNTTGPRTQIETSHEKPRGKAQANIQSQQGQPAFRIQSTSGAAFPRRSTLQSDEKTRVPKNKSSNSLPRDGAAHSEKTATRGAIRSLSSVGPKPPLEKFESPKMGKQTVARNKQSRVVHDHQISRADQPSRKSTSPQNVPAKGRAEGSAGAPQRTRHPTNGVAAGASVPKAKLTPSKPSATGEKAAYTRKPAHNEAAASKPLPPSSTSPKATTKKSGTSVLHSILAEVSIDGSVTAASGKKGAQSVKRGSIENSVAGRDKPKSTRNVSDPFHSGHEAVTDSPSLPTGKDGRQEKPSLANGVPAQNEVQRKTRVEKPTKDHVERAPTPLNPAPLTSPSAQPDASKQVAYTSTSSNPSNRSRVSLHAPPKRPAARTTPPSTKEAANSWTQEPTQVTTDAAHPRLPKGQLEPQPTSYSVEKPIDSCSNREPRSSRSSESVELETQALRTKHVRIPSGPTEDGFDIYIPPAPGSGQANGNNVTYGRTESEYTSRGVATPAVRKLPAAHDGKQSAPASASISKTTSSTTNTSGPGATKSDSLVSSVPVEIGQDGSNVPTANRGSIPAGGVPAPATAHPKTKFKEIVTVSERETSPPATSKPVSKPVSQALAIIPPRPVSEAVALQQPGITLQDQRVSGPAPEPYFEYRIKQKMWPEAGDERDAITLAVGFHSTVLETANKQAEEFFTSTKEQYLFTFPVQHRQMSSVYREDGCLELTATLATMGWPASQVHLKIWVERGEVSSDAARINPAPKLTPFLSKTLYTLRLYKLADDPSSDPEVEDDSGGEGDAESNGNAEASSSDSDGSSESETDPDKGKHNKKRQARQALKDSPPPKRRKKSASVRPGPSKRMDETAATKRVVRQYRQIPCPEVYTTLFTANSAACELQSRIMNEQVLQNEQMRAKNDAILRRKLLELADKDGEERYWHNEFPAGVAGGRMEIMVEAVGVCGPRNA